MIWLFVILFTKHLVADFLLQPKWMWANKGTLGHWGGIAHALLHGVLTMLILGAFIGFYLAFVLAAAETVAHYFIDWAKMNLNARMGWQANTSEKFWWLLGLDQWMHAMCYCAIAAVVF